MIFFNPCTERVTLSGCILDAVFLPICVTIKWHTQGFSSPPSLSLSCTSDRAAASEHLPLAWTRSSLEDETLLMAKLKEIAERFSDNSSTAAEPLPQSQENWIWAKFFYIPHKNFDIITWSGENHAQNIVDIIVLFLYNWHNFDLHRNVYAIYVPLISVVNTNT